MNDKTKALDIAMSLIDCELPTLESTFKYSKFKSFDKVLVRANKDCKWVPRFFAIMKDDVYCDTNGSWAKYCIPYEGNEHLLGTTIEPECVS